MKKAAGRIISQVGNYLAQNIIWDRQDYYPWS